MKDQKPMDQDYQALLDLLPPFVIEYAREKSILLDMDEVILDVGRNVEIRRKDSANKIDTKLVTYEDIDSIVSRIPPFTEDNRSGIDRTLHRISAMRNRKGRIVGLTLRVGRAVVGSVDVIRDLLDREKSILLMGPPGSGKTTRLREIARVLAEKGKRVVVVDTSNEIAGEGDIPHSGIGDSRRMQVPHPDMQHAVMIEAVENHMPEVIIVDEIGTEMEARAARTIAERGVQLVATAHGQNIYNLIKNPTLSDLIGGIETATLSDEEAKRRGTQKTIQERAAEPTFGILIELQDRYSMLCYKDVARSVDIILRGGVSNPERRQIKEDGQVLIEKTPSEPESTVTEDLKIFPFAINRANLEFAIKSLRVSCIAVNSAEEADLILTTKAYLKRNSNLERLAHDNDIPIYVIKSSTTNHLTKFLLYILKIEEPSESREMVKLDALMLEAVKELESSAKPIELPPANAYTRRYQHQFLANLGIHSESLGKEPNRRVAIYGHK